LNKKFNYYKHLISYLTGTCYNFEMEEFFSSFLRRAGMPASAGLSCIMKVARCRAALYPYVQTQTATRLLKLTKHSNRPKKQHKETN